VVLVPITQTMLASRRASFVDTHLEGIVSEAYLITAQTARDAAALLKEQTIVEDATRTGIREHCSAPTPWRRGLLSAANPHPMSTGAARSAFFAKPLPDLDDMAAAASAPRLQRSMLN
jgi:hypothetical protein